MPFWALMIFLPFWSMTHRILSSVLCVVPAALLYAVLVLPGVAQIFPVLMNPSTPAIAEVLGQPIGALIAWVHFLAFDLFVGRWIFLDSRERKLPFWMISPILFFTLMLGPFGLLLYLGLRSSSSTPESVSTAGNA